MTYRMTTGQCTTDWEVAGYRFTYAYPGEPCFHEDYRTEREALEAMRASRAPERSVMPVKRPRWTCDCGASAYGLPYGHHVCNY